MANWQYYMVYERLMNIPYCTVAFQMFVAALGRYDSYMTRISSFQFIESLGILSMNVENSVNNLKQRVFAFF
jgi:hypothetical protein